MINLLSRWYFIASIVTILLRNRIVTGFVLWHGRKELSLLSKTNEVIKDGDNSRLFDGIAETAWSIRTAHLRHAYDE